MQDELSVKHPSPLKCNYAEHVQTFICARMHTSVDVLKHPMHTCVIVPSVHLR